MLVEKPEEFLLESRAIWGETSIESFLRARFPNPCSQNSGEGRAAGGPTP